MVQTITLKKVLIAGRKYYDARNLQYQDRKLTASSSCEYESESGCRCIVGSALTKKSIALLHKSGMIDEGIRTVLDLGHLAFKGTEQELAELVLLQDHHDSALVGDGKAKKSFREYFFHLEKKYGTR